MRVAIKLQGAASAQSLFDVMAGHNVRWKELGRSWHEITFDCTSLRDASDFIRMCWPDLKFYARLPRTPDEAAFASGTTFSQPAGV